MRHLELFFDYACPYCLRAHELLLELLPLHSDIEIDWLMYRAALIERADIEDPAVVARAAAPLLDAGALEQALRGGRYERELQKANAYAFDRSGVWAVPAYRMDGRRLDARENIGVTRGELAAFLAG